MNTYIPTGSVKMALTVTDLALERFYTSLWFPKLMT
jgi:hypothetical protein